MGVGGRAHAEGPGREVIRSGREPLAGVEGGGGRGSEEGLSGSLEGYSLSVKADNLLRPHFHLILMGHVCDRKPALSH